MFNIKLIFLLSICIASVGADLLKAEIKLSAILGDNMVLQQQTYAAIWGKAAPGKNVKVTTSWDHKSYYTLSDVNGDWKVKVKTPVAGGPYEVTISDGSSITLKNVLIGEVWFCSGQSNMGRTLRGGLNSPVLNSNETIATSANKYIRLFTVGRNTSLEPLTNLTGKWNECQPENVAGFSAVAYFFGQLVQKALDVPVGLINSSWGGTPIEAWMGEEGIRKFDFVKSPSKSDEEKLKELYPKTPSILFNAMVNPLKAFPIKGVIWYQGEDNVKNPEQYVKLMPGLIENWRNEWGIGSFPFYYVQIAPYDYGPNLNSAFLREAQLIASTAINNTGMACLLDAGEKDDIHPGNKKVVGERLAYLALANSYGKGGIEYSGPEIKSMIVDGFMVNLTFYHAKNGLTTFGKELVNFKVAGDNKHFYSAKAFITKTGISLYSEYVAKPVAVRYAFENFVAGELYNTEGLPASSFRTDKWKD